MNVVFYNRDFSGKLPLPESMKVRIERYSWNMNGGPRAATLRANTTEDRFDLRKLLRCPVEIEGTDGKVKWYGYVNRVNIPNGDEQRVGVGLDELYNYVTVAYSDGDTAVASDTASVTEYGQKEVRINDNNATQTEGEQKRDLYLADHQYPHLEFEFSGGDADVIIECYGWYDTLGWQYYANSSASNVENTTQISAIVTAAGQFMAGSNIENTAGITSNEYRDGAQTALSNINQLLNAGTTNTRPLLARVDRSRYLHVYERTAPPPTELVKYIMRSDGKLESQLGTLEPDENCTVAVWARLKEFSDFPPFFIERAEYIWDENGGKTVYTPAGAFEQIRLARYVADVVNNAYNGGGGSGGTYYPYIPITTSNPRPCLHRYGVDLSDMGAFDYLDISTAPSSLLTATYAGLNYFNPTTVGGNAMWEVLITGIYIVELNVEIGEGSVAPTSGYFTINLYLKHGAGLNWLGGDAGSGSGWAGAWYSSIAVKSRMGDGDYLVVIGGNTTDGDVTLSAAYMTATFERATS